MSYPAPQLYCGGAVGVWSCMPRLRFAVKLRLSAIRTQGKNTATLKKKSQVGFISVCKATFILLYCLRAPNKHTLVQGTSRAAGDSWLPSTEQEHGIPGEQDASEPPCGKQLF